jgi:hypothetical protein
LTGLKVHNNPHYTLTAIYGKILRAIAKMPQDASYRKYTEQIVNDRLRAVQQVRWDHHQLVVYSTDEFISRTKM